MATPVLLTHEDYNIAAAESMNWRVETWQRACACTRRSVDAEPNLRQTYKAATAETGKYYACFVNG